MAGNLLIFWGGKGVEHGTVLHRPAESVQCNLNKTVFRSA